MTVPSETTPPRRTRYFAVAGDLIDQAQASRAGGDGATPVTPRPAATVMIVRDATAQAAGSRDTASDTGAGVEVFMLRRRSTMAFAPNRMVFPGGGVDERDGDPNLPWAGPSPAQWATWLGARDDEEARELVVAAARECFEECGVLLAGEEGATVVGDTSGAEWRAERDRLLSREQSFAEMLIRRGLVLRTDLLRPWAHWVTPEFEKRRYDTRFFAAVVPTEQIPDDHTTEADMADWVRPRDLLDQAEAGQAHLLPPTLVCLEEVAAAPDAATFLTAAPPMGCVMPVLEEYDGGLRLRTDLPVREEDS